MFFHSIKKLLAINRNTGIETRASVLDFKQGFATGPDLPTIAELDQHFRSVGVDLAAQACSKALDDAGISAAEITHTVAVTCTSQGNPGYNLLVHERLGLNSDVDNTLLHGVGCAGGLSIMRAAVQMALAATARGKPARVLAFACELCTPLVRNELAVAEKSKAENVSVAAALFSDAAAAFVLTNDLGKGRREARLQLCAFGNEVLPATMGHMSFLVDAFGASFQFVDPTVIELTCVFDRPSRYLDPSNTFSHYQSCLADVQEAERRILSIAWRF